MGVWRSESSYAMTTVLMLSFHIAGVSVDLPVAVAIGASSDGSNSFELYDSGADEIDGLIKFETDAQGVLAISSQDGASINAGASAGLW